jgi:hypothetical protein
MQSGTASIRRRVAHSSIVLLRRAMTNQGIDPPNISEHDMQSSTIRSLVAALLRACGGPVGVFTLVLAISSCGSSPAAGDEGVSPAEARSRSDASPDSGSGGGDGSACTLTSTACNPDCQQVCGSSPRCTDLCCPAAIPIWRAAPSSTFRPARRSRPAALGRAGPPERLAPRDVRARRVACAAPPSRCKRSAQCAARTAYFPTRFQTCRCQSASAGSRTRTLYPSRSASAAIAALSSTRRSMANAGGYLTQRSPRRSSTSR